ncbi:MAG TPA: alpha/beta hydrolase, partial [Acidimicrobiales bacterium]|nr:alpha/beta hydrolase [Acidimicrobiales bacterium]
PVLVIFGAEDQVATRMDDDLRVYREVPRSTVEVVEGAGHSPHVEQPDRTARLIVEFIDR